MLVTIHVVVNISVCVTAAGFSIAPCIKRTERPLEKDLPWQHVFPRTIEFASSSSASCPLNEATFLQYRNKKETNDSNRHGFLRREQVCFQGKE